MIQNEASITTTTTTTTTSQTQQNRNNNNNQQQLVIANNGQMVLHPDSIEQKKNPHISKVGTFNLEEIMKFMEGCVIISDKSPNEKERMNFLSFLLEKPIQMFVHPQNRAKMSRPNDILKSMSVRGDQEDIVRSLVLFTSVCKRVRNSHIIVRKYFVKLLPVLLELIKTLHTMYHPRYIQSIPKEIFMTIINHQASTLNIPKNKLFRKMKSSIYFILGYCAEFVPEFWSNRNLVKDLSTSIFHNFDHLNIIDLRKLIKHFVVPFVKHIPKTSFPQLQKILMPILMNSLKSISSRFKNRRDFSTPNNASLQMKQNSINQETWYDKEESKLYYNCGKLMQSFEHFDLLMFLKKNDPLYLSFCEITLNMLYNSASLKFFYIFKQFFINTLDQFYKNRRFETMIAFHLLKALIYQLTKSIDMVNQQELIDLISRVYTLYNEISKYPDYIFSKINRNGLDVLKKQIGSKSLPKMKKKKIKIFLKPIIGKKINLNLNINEANNMFNQ